MYSKFNTFFVAFLLVVICAGQLQAESFSGKLVKVIKGDTVEVLSDGKAQLVRLAQIYAPWEDQPFGQTAINFVWRTAGQQTVTVQYHNLDLYGRSIGEVFLADGTNLNKLIIGAGYAWRYVGFSKDPEYADLETGARTARLGLWGVDTPVPPWEWRWLQSASKTFTCGDKRYCHEMSSCEEAKFYLYACGLSRLDSNRDGIPCEARCK